MTFIIQHDFKIFDTPYYVRLVDNSTFEEVYNPAFATTFKTRQEAQQWIDVSSPMKSHSKIVDLDKSIKQYNEWFRGGTVRRTLNCINRTMSRPYNNEPIDEVIDWWIFCHNNDDEIDDEDFETWPDLYQMSKHLRDVQVYHSSDYKELYVTCEIYTRKDGDFAEFQSELDRVIDKVTFKDREGYLIFPIFDHYLSEHGNREQLLIHPETKEVRIEGGWQEQEYSSLQDAFDYIKSERYYE